MYVNDFRLSVRVEPKFHPRSRDLFKASELELHFDGEMHYAVKRSFFFATRTFHCFGTVLRNFLIKGESF